MTSAEKRVKLKGVLAQTVSSAEIRGDGGLVIELYDFSDEAERCLGNAVAFMLIVASKDKGKVLSGLMAGQGGSPDVTDADELLLRLIGERFADYYAVKRWLDESEIPYQKEFDSWA